MPSPSGSDSGADKRALNWSYVLVGVADGTLLPFVPLFLLHRGLGAPEIGAVLAAAGLASLIAGLNWAYLSDRRLRAERIVVVAAAAASCAALLLAVSDGAVVLTAVIVVLWLARAPFMLLDPIALRRLRTARRTEYARIRLRMSAGWAASVTATGAAYQLLTLRLMPFVYAPLTLVFGMWVWHAITPADRQEPVAEPRVRRSAYNVPPALIGFLVSSFVLGAAVSATGNFLTLQITVLGGGAFLVGAAAAFQALTEIPTMGYTHVLTRYLSHRRLFAAGCVIYVFIFTAWAFVSNPLVAAVLKLAVGVAFALTYVASVVITDELTPAPLRATGLALMKAVAFGLAPIAGSLGGGIVYGFVGARAMFLVSAGLAAAAGALVLVALPIRARRLAVEPVPAAAEPAPVTP